MKCPRCKNPKFKPTEEIKYPLQNLGKKEHYNTLNIRRYICLECSYRFKTQEIYFMDIEEQEMVSGDGR